MHIGVCHDVTIPGEWEAAIAQAGALGFEGIELFLRPATMANLLDQPGRAGQLRDAAERAHLQLPSLGLVVFGPQFRLSDPDATARRATVERVRVGIQRCAELGGTVVLLPSAPAMSDGPAVDAFVTSLRELAPTAADLGIRLGIETGYTGDETREILDKIDQPAVYDYFDTGNAAGRGMDPAEEIRGRNRRLGQIHVKGLRGADLAEGSVDLAAVSQALRDVGYDGWLMLETSAGDNPVAAAERNLAVMRQYFGAN